MKKLHGFSKAGVIATITALMFVIVAIVLVINANTSSVNYADYDLFSIITPDSHNGNIGDHVKGDEDAPVIIFEYADFQCPGCASMNTRVNEAIKEADGKLAIVYRNYLLSYHKNGTAAASAAEAAGLQGYWKPYADKLFENQAEWEYSVGSERTTLFDKYFTEVTDGKGDLDKFHKDIASDQVSQKISFDMGAGKHIGIPATPAFFIDGQLITWTSKEGGKITVNGKELSWDHALTGAEFADLLADIIEAKTSH